MAEGKDVGDEDGLVYRAIELNSPEPWLLLMLMEVLRRSNGGDEKESPRVISQSDRGSVARKPEGDGWVSERGPHS